MDTPMRRGDDLQQRGASPRPLSLWPRRPSALPKQRATSGFGYKTVCCCHGNRLSSSPGATTAAGAEQVPTARMCSGRWCPLQVVGGDVSLAVADAALVDHGSVVGHLHRLADAGLAALHDAQLVGRVVHAQRRHLLPGQPLPAATPWRQTERKTRITK